GKRTILGLPPGVDQGPTLQTNQDGSLLVGLGSVAQSEYRVFHWTESAGFSFVEGFETQAWTEFWLSGNGGVVVTSNRLIWDTGSNRVRNLREATDETGVSEAFSRLFGETEPVIKGITHDGEVIGGTVSSQPSVWILFSGAVALRLRRAPTFWPLLQDVLGAELRLELLRHPIATSGRLGRVRLRSMVGGGSSPMSDGSKGLTMNRAGTGSG